MVVDRLNTWLDYNGNYEDLTPEELVSKNMVDIVRVFIKDEPHKKAKIADGRYRLISSVSIVDQIIERLLHSKQNNNEIENWTDCPSKPGLGLHDDGMSALADNFKELLKVNGEVMCTDVSAFDWTVQEWELRDDMEMRIVLAKAKTDSVYAHFCRINAMVMARSVFMDPDGICYAQVVYGIQKSGRYCTSSSNSRIRVIITCNARKKIIGIVLINGKVAIMTMGDDSVEAALREIIDEMVRMGHNIKEVTFNNKLEDIEFCSQIWNADGTARPAAPAKTVFKFLSRPRNHKEYAELWSQLSWYLRHLVGPTKDIISKLAVARIEGANKLNNIDGNTSTKEPSTKAETEGITIPEVSA